MLHILLLAAALAATEPKVSPATTPPTETEKVFVLHQKNFVSTVRTADGTLNAEAASEMDLGPGWKIRHKTLGKTGHQVQIWLAQHNPQKPLVVFCGGRNFEPDYNGGESLKILAGFGDVLLFDYPGLGSDGSGSKADYQGLTNLLSDEIQSRMRRRHSPLLFWGHRLGSAVCARLAANISYPSTLIIDGIVPDVFFRRHVPEHQALGADLMPVQLKDILQEYPFPFYTIMQKREITAIKHIFAANDLHPVVLSGREDVQLFLNPSFIFLKIPGIFRPIRDALTSAGFPYHPLPGVRYRPRGRTGCKAIAGSHCIYARWPDGTRFTGHVREGDISGPATIRFADGGKMKTNYAENRISGFYHYVSPTGVAHDGFVPPPDHTMIVNGQRVQAPRPLVGENKNVAWYGYVVAPNGKPIASNAFGLHTPTARQKRDFVVLKPSDAGNFDKLISQGHALPYIKFEETGLAN